MKRTIVISLFIVLLASMSAMAATTGSGALTVNATVVGSVNLVFNNDASGVALTSGAGTNAATLNFGFVQAFGGTVPTNVTRTVAASSFTVSTPVDVYVTKSNSTSATYSLTAALGTADATNTWTVGGVTLSTTAASITTTGAYAATGAQVVGLTIPFTNTNTSITNVINFTATAN